MAIKVRSFNALPASLGGYSFGLLAVAIVDPSGIGLRFGAVAERILEDWTCKQM